MAYPPTPPLLLTRRLSSFLHASLATLQEQHQQQPVLQTALLITPSGKLLAYDSTVPVRTLRTQSSVAASLWAIHAASSPSVAVALGKPPAKDGRPLRPADDDSDQDSSDREDGNSPGHSPHHHDGSLPVSIAASFNGGAVFVVRRLRCGLLFACATPPPSAQHLHPPAGLAAFASAPSSRPATAASAAPTPIASHAVPPLEAAHSPLADSSVADTATSPATLSVSADDGRPGTATDAASMTSTGTTATAAGPAAGGSLGHRSSVAATVAVARRQVEELARLLDDKLGSLSVPEENIGVNGFR